MERHRQAAEHKDRIAAHEEILTVQFQEQKCQLSEKDRAQQKDLLERLIVQMAARIQAYAASTSRPESPPQYHVLQNRNNLDSSWLHATPNKGLNSS